MPFCVTLRSGSSGNCTLIYDGEAAFLVDCGIGLRELRAAFSAFGIPFNALGAVFLTHEHSDHTALLRHYHRLDGLTVIASAGTLGEVTAKLNVTHSRVIEKKTPLVIGNTAVTRFETPHDAKESCGYVFELPGGKVGVCTDLGFMPRPSLDTLKGCGYVILESNYDVDMLVTGPYPPFLRRRILGRRGHLSNDDCADCAVELAGSGTGRITLAHISEENNDPAAAMGAVLGTLEDRGLHIDVDIAPRYEPGLIWRC